MRGMLPTALICICSIYSAHAESIDVVVSPLAVENNVRLFGIGGTLTYKGGFELSSYDVRFGGFSGLVLNRDGTQMTAISDQGWWLNGTLTYSGHGELTSLVLPELFPMLSPDGRKPQAEKSSDAEAIVQFPNGDLVVAFERDHRLWSYSNILSPARRFATNPIVSTLPYNRGIEALVTLDAGRLLAISESGPTDSSLNGWILEGMQATPFTYHSDGYFRPSDAVALDDGRILVLERGYTKNRGVSARLMTLDVTNLEPDDSLQPSQFMELGIALPLDNFEGVAFRRDPTGAKFIYLMSDDNYNRSQRTLFMMFEFEDTR